MRPAERNHVKLSIVIPAFNEELLIGQTLADVRNAAERIVSRGWQVETIVCDNNSTDRTAELARAGGANVVFEPVNQIGRARNRGAQAATGDWLIFIDADSRPSPELFEEVAGVIATGRYLAGGTTVKLDGPETWGRRIVAFWNVISRWKKWMAGSFIFCETSAFRDIGGFSPELFATEELDLSKRLHVLARRRGQEIIILHRNPLLTSNRKMHLYTVREHAAFMVRTVWSGGRTLNSREACHVWYDGRR